MKRIATGLLTLGVLLAGCSGNGAATANDTAKGKSEETERHIHEPTKQDVQFGETFTYITTESARHEVLDQLKMKVENMRIESNLGDRAELNEEFDYLLLDVSMENIGQSESDDYTFSYRKFTLYNKNGMEIPTYTSTSSLPEFMEGEFKGAKLRPNGKNEGTIVVPFAKDEGENISEIILDTSANADNSSQFIFKLSK
ncbi:DUF4352 domain-containing protein [Rossellomorea aquimaris]|nr:DUF4352 domain-containing protein [Rossellomorea vietnamensis]